MNDKITDAELEMLNHCCKECGGLGWLGDARAGQLPYLAKLALMGRFPKKVCPRCSRERKGVG